MAAAWQEPSSDAEGMKSSKRAMPGLSSTARWVIHAVGPVWGSGDEDRKLQAAYTNALQLAHDKQFASIAFPSISTGIFGFPVERGVAIGVQAAVNFCTAHPDSPLR